jgi:molybdenum cofactor biosynthesis protein B
MIVSARTPAGQQGKLTKTPASVAKKEPFAAMMPRQRELAVSMTIPPGVVCECGEDFCILVKESPWEQLPAPLDLRLAIWGDCSDIGFCGGSKVSDAVDEHRAASPAALNLAVITVSDTRTPATDKSGDLITALAEAAGHRVVERAIVPDGPHILKPLLESLSRRVDLHAVLVTGGTGISPRDQTYETVVPLLTKTLGGFGELFRMLSYSEIGPACLLSRAVGGLIGQTVVLVMPGSRAAVELAINKIILPELPHLVREARKS